MVSYRKANKMVHPLDPSPVRSSVADLFIVTAECSKVLLHKEGQPRCPSAFSHYPYVYDLR